MTSLSITADSRGVATITLNRPEIHNAFDDKLIRELTQAFQQLNKKDAVRLIVLAAEGKSFSAGADLNWMRKMADYSWEQNYQDSLALATLMQTIHQSRKPTLALVQGAAFGGGVGLAACCDIVLADETALFCLSEVKLGLIPSVISPYVIAAIGQRQASRYFISAERFSAQTAQQMGLVHQCFDSASFAQESEKVIAQILTNGPEAIVAAKQLIQQVSDHPINEELIRETAQRIADIRASKQGKEGVSAFLEKRPPNWLESKES